MCYIAGCSFEGMDAVMKLLPVVIFLFSWISLRYSGSFSTREYFQSRIAVAKNSGSML